MIAVVIILILFLCLGWVLLFRYFKALQVAHINLVKQAQKEAALLYQLKEVNEKYHKLEDKLQKVQFELYTQQHKESHS
ncbi:hypothetical protein ACDQ55_19375 [Chitinophaga sp. 30R24]|uniref:hypothetical protein n=1 Tax=Chitinophaga sp. 30R24 TaxID=3248838 RepID=UPI003B91CB79